MNEIGLFPLDLVLLPGEQRPLHIFEERYKELIGECLEDGAEFGLVLADDEGMRPVGTRAAVVEVLQEFEDGRMDVVVEGRQRFRLVELTEGRSYATAEVDDVDDEVEESPTGDEVERAVDAFQRVVQAAQVEVDEVDPAAGGLSFQIGARIDLGNEVKQSLLEITSERERLTQLEPLLRRAAESVRVDREVRERASGNGRVEPLP
ncbi:MAG TPA: LON peptidase substrate-binding domain-containing protein [Gaiellaceae bacterium]|nr:LON peptidase substrate-binding domain-containing protein [Gaiellaceae bacterium]